jgi:hypothetical protein
VLALVAVHSGAVEEGLEALSPLRRHGKPIAAAVDAMPYSSLQTAFDAGNPHGGRYYWKSQYLAGLPDELLDLVVGWAEDLHGAYSIIGIEPMGGAQGRVDPAASAFIHRQVPYSLGIWTGWPDSADDKVNIDWTRSFFRAVQPFGAGAYVNYLGEDEGYRLDEVYGANYERLLAIKKKWDPDNLFRENHNIG